MNSGTKTWRSSPAAPAWLRSGACSGTIVKTLRRFNSVHLIAGFKDIGCVLFEEDLNNFKCSFNTVCTLDNSEAPGFATGLVTAHIKKIPFASFSDYNVIIVGPPIMNAFWQPGNAWPTGSMRAGCGYPSSAKCPVPSANAATARSTRPTSVSRARFSTTPKPRTCSTRFKRRLISVL